MLFDKINYIRSFTMKTQKLRLSFKKQTITTLGAERMNQVNGGLDYNPTLGGFTVPLCTEGCPVSFIQVCSNPCDTKDCQSVPAYVTCWCGPTETPDC
jgi:hypothetical protein